MYTRVFRLNFCTYGMAAMISRAESLAP